MDSMVHMQYMPGDIRLVDQIILELKSKGIFDQFRKDCISDVDTRPAYQNLRLRVESSVTGFLSNQKWLPDINKNQMREKLRKHILDANYLEQGVERIVDQVVNPKVVTVFKPLVENLVYNYFGVERPKPATIEREITFIDLTGLPNDLEAVSPESNHDDMDKVDEPEEETKMDVDEENAPKTPTFEPVHDKIELPEETPLSDMIDLTLEEQVDVQDIPLPSEEIKLENIPPPNDSPPQLKLEDIELPKDPTADEISCIPLPDEMPDASNDINDEYKVNESDIESDSSCDSSLRRNVSPLTPIRNFDNDNSYDAKQGFDSPDVKDDKKPPVIPISTFRFTIENKEPESANFKGIKDDKFKLGNQLSLTTFSTPLLQAYEDSSDSNNLHIDYESDNSKLNDVKTADTDNSNSSKTKSKDSKDDKKSSHKSSHSSREKSRDKDRDKKSDKHSSSKDRKDSKSDKKTSNSDGKSKSKESSHKDSKDDKKDRDSSKHRHSSHKSNKDSHRSSSSSNRHSSKHDDSKSKSKDHRSSKDSKSKDRRSSSSKKTDDKDKKDKKSTDDHYSASGRGNNNRRSTDRDSNDGNSTSSKGSNFQSSSKSSNNKRTSKSSSKSDHTSSSETTGQSDSVNITSDKAQIKPPIIRLDSHLETPICEPTHLPFIEEISLKKPKFAANFEEAREMMKLRNALSAEERKKNQDAALLLEFQQNVRLSSSQVYSSIPGPELEIACSSYPVENYIVEHIDNMLPEMNLDIESAMFELHGEAGSNDEIDPNEFDNDISNIEEDLSENDSTTGLTDEIAENSQKLRYFTENEKFNADLEFDTFSKFFKSACKNEQLYLVNCDSNTIEIIKEVAKEFGDFDIIDYNQNGCLKVNTRDVRIDSEEISLPVENYYDVFSPIKSDCSIDLDYDNKIKDMVNSKTRQEILEIILGGGIDESPSKMPKVNIGKDFVLNNDDLKRKLSFENNDNNNKDILSPNKIRKNSDNDLISSTVQAPEPIFNNKTVVKSKYLGKAKRVGLPKPKKVVLLNSSSSDKSVENYESNCSTTTSNKVKPRNALIQRYETSDLYKPKLHYLSKRKIT